MCHIRIVLKIKDLTHDTYISTCHNLSRNGPDVKKKIPRKRGTTREKRRSAYFAAWTGVRYFTATPRIMASVSMKKTNFFMA